LNITGLAAGAYALSALLYAFLAILLLTQWRGREKGGYLLTACVVTSFWAAVNAWALTATALPAIILWVAETLHGFAWLFFLIAVLSPAVEKGSGTERILNAARLVLLALVAVLLLSLDEASGIGALLARNKASADIKLVGHLLLAVAGITLIEQVLRNTSPDRRPAVKYLAIALGVHFIFDFYLYSDALMFRRLNQNLWMSRGFVHLFSLPLLMVAAARNPDWSLPISLSRRVVLHTSALLGAGIYLLVMALVGYYIRLFGGEWGTVLRTVFLFSAGMILAMLFVSGRLRRHLRVLINKHFFAYRYDYRDEWLKLIATLTGRLSPRPLPERVIAALGEIVDSPGGVVFLVGERGGYRAKGQLEHPPVTLADERHADSLVAFLERTRWVVDIDEYRSRSLAYEGLNLPAWIEQVRNPWLIVPLVHDERLIGFVVLTRPPMPEPLDWESLDLLKTAGLQAASYLALNQAAESLAEARQFEGFNRLSAFVIHDLKNLVAQLSLVVDNAQRHKANPAFIDDAVRTIENSVGKMNRLMAQLRLVAAPPAAELVELGDLLTGVVEAHQRQHPAPRFDGATTPVHVRANPDRLAAVIGHIVQNAQDATPATGQVAVRLEVRGGSAVVVVEDNGSGMDETFVRDRLFRPFDSTKGLTGMGIGAYECRELVRSLGGHVDVQSAPGRGTIFTIALPHASGRAPAIAG